MKQPTKDALREQLALAADEIIRLRQTPPANYFGVMCNGLDIRRASFDEAFPQRQPWWRSLFR